jgi:hypothetical protein
MPETSYRVSSCDIVWQCFDDELILIHLGTGVYYSVTPGGAAIWRLMEAGYSREEVAAHAPDRNEVLAFWQVLIDEGLIVPGGEKHGAAELPPAEELARPAISVYKDMQDLFLLDPIHDVNEAGWPSYQPPAGD